MSKFESFLSEHGIPIGELATPAERLLMRLGLITSPVGLLNYPVRALWFSVLFTVMYLGSIELILRGFLQISFFSAIPLELVVLSICILLLFGPFAAYFSCQSAMKHRAVLQKYWHNQ
jgi:hypothetical protein